VCGKRGCESLEAGKRVGRNTVMVCEWGDGGSVSFLRLTCPSLSGHSGFEGRETEYQKPLGREKLT
jgi:hypothetical protein